MSRARFYYNFKRVLARREKIRNEKLSKMTAEERQQFLAEEDRQIEIASKRAYVKRLRRMPILEMQARQLKFNSLTFILSLLIIIAYVIMN